MSMEGDISRFNRENATGGYPVYEKDHERCLRRGCETCLTRVVTIASFMDASVTRR